MVQAYLHDNDNSVDFRTPHNSGTPVSLEELDKIGVIYRYCASQDDVEQLAEEREYKNRDVVDIRPETFGGVEAYMNKLKVFYEEHLHEDEEIRYCMEGEGYFALKNPFSDKWIRGKVARGDLLVVPAGIYHRFVTTESDHIKALRLFKDEPKWQAIGKSETADTSTVRKDYLKSIGLAN